MKRVVNFSFAMLLATLVLTLPVVGSVPTLSFNLLGPQTAGNPSNGETIAVTGAGSFDTVSQTVVASGSFAILNASGAAISHGIWKATAFDSFTHFAGTSPDGLQGGVLKITVTLFPTGAAPVTGVSMTVNCLINAPPSFTGAEGVIVGDFTNSIRGRTLFHLNQ